MLEHQIALHKLWINNVNLKWLSPEILNVIDNMKTLIEDLVEDRKELIQSLTEEWWNSGVGNL